MELDVLGKDAKTEVGAYFVSNYPPYSQWRAEHVPAAREVLAAPAEKPPPLGLYLHIPFCRKRCKFCYFRVYTDKNSSDVDAYMNALAGEIALYKDYPRLAERQFEFVYFGGGTPSFLSSAQLERLIERINQHWRWDAAREVTFECEPGTLKKHKLETIRAIGVTRLSIGFEHLDDGILEENGRAHRSAEILQAYDWAREIGFRQINVDLIAGMVGDDEAKWKDAVQRTLELAPDSLTIYQMELPANTTYSRQTRATGQSPVADWQTKRRWVGWAFDLFESAGYVVSSGYTVVRPSPESRFVYRDSLWHGADMVGTGVASFSHVGGVHYQNLDQWEDYISEIDQGRLPHARALPTSPHQRLIRELVLQLKLGHVELGYFREKFGVEVSEVFADAIQSIAGDGFGTLEGDALALTRDGLLRVDGLLPRFFEQPMREVRSS